MQFAPSCFRLLFKAFVVLMCLSTGTAIAAEWNGTASISPSLTYTDNVCLTKDDKKGDFTGVALLTPAGSFSHKTRKSSFSASGSVQVNTLTDGDLRDNGCTGTQIENREKFFPNLSAKGSTVLIDDWLKVDVAGRADQNEITFGLPGGGDDLDRTGNTNTFYRYSIAPTLSHRLKNNARYNVRYGYDKVINTADTLSNSSRQIVRANLQSGESSQVSWNLLGKYTKVSYEDGFFNRISGQFQPRQDTELRSARLQLGYRISRRWQVNGSYGWEFNDIQTFNNADTDGQAWDIGVLWTPTRRTSVSLGSGDRFFGSTPRLNITHQRKRNTFSANYNKTITFRRDITTGGNNLVEGIGINASLGTESAILDERGTLSWSYGGRYASMSLNGSYSQQTRAIDGAKGVFKNVAFTYSPMLSQSYSVSATVAYDEDKPAGFVGLPNVQDFAGSRSWIYNVNFSKPINNRLSASITYQFTDRQSDTNFNEYQENRVIATLNINL